MGIMNFLSLLLPAAFLAAALFSLIRGADLFVEGAKQIGASLGMSKFVIGVLIVGVGTSLPELASSIAAVLSGQPEIPIANAVGSNITNILLIIGVLVAVGGRIIIKRDLIKTELPIFAVATIQFILMIQDGVVDRLEAVLLLGTFAAYIWYLFSEAESEDDVNIVKESGRRPNLRFQALIFIALGVAAVLVGAHYTVESMVTIATILSVPIGLVSIAAIAIGTSLPELFVSLQAIKNGETEMAVGNIFGSNTFNLLVVIGIPALISPLIAGEVVMQHGIGILVAASAILFISGLARQIMRWEGVMFLLFFGFFIAKLTAFI